MTDKEFKVEVMLRGLKSELGTVEDLYEETNSEATINDVIDTAEESMKLYIQYLRDGIKGE